MKKRCAREDDKNILVRYKSQKFIEIIKEADIMKGFDIDIYFIIIKKMIVVEGNKIIVTLLDGTEVEVGIE
jgi:site-specific DNA recombinase